jgi:hypothetical protein
MVALLLVPLGILASDPQGEDRDGTLVPRESFQRTDTNNRRRGAAPSNVGLPSQIISPAREAYFLGEKELEITFSDGKTQRFQLNEEDPREETSNVLNAFDLGTSCLPLVQAYPIKDANGCDFIIWEQGGSMWNGRLSVKEGSLKPDKPVSYHINA